MSGCGFTNQPPNAAFTSSTDGFEVTFDASNSSNPDGSIVSYEWDFGDGSTGSGKKITHTFDSHIDVTVELTVTDNDGATSTAQITFSWAI